MNLFLLLNLRLNLSCSIKMENRVKITWSTLSSNLFDLFRSISEAMKNPPFVRLCGATFLVFNGFQMVAAFSVYIIVFYLFNGSYGAAGTWPAWFSSITAVVTAFFVIPAVILLGLVILIVFGLFERRRNQMLSVVSDLRQWEP